MLSLVSGKFYTVLRNSELDIQQIFYAVILSEFLEYYITLPPPVGERVTEWNY